MGYEQHRSAAAHVHARCAVVTLSDTRTEATDKSGTRVRDLLASQSHEISAYHLIRDDPDTLDALLAELDSRPGLDVILTNGGTGISRRDNTVPVIRRHLAVEIGGFGELFRMLSYQQVRSAAMLSRALGGITPGGKLIFAMPGSTPAVELAMNELILPELKHLLAELRKA